MRTALLANNRLGARIGRYLAARDELVALVVHPEDRRRCGDELLALDVPTWTWPEGRDELAALEPECLLSVLFSFVLDESWLALPSWRAVNIHPALLPWNRGAAPNVWPLVDGSPAGTTLHVMDPGIDTGPLVAQQAVEVLPSDTAHTLYARLEEASEAMFAEVWPAVRDIEPWAQPPGGSSHRVRDLALLDLDDTDLATVDKLRARSFPPYGAEFERDGRRWRARIEIEPLH